MKATLITAMAVLVICGVCLAVNCPKCGKGVPEGSKFCPDCGAKFTTPPGGQAPAPGPGPVGPGARTTKDPAKTPTSKPGVSATSKPGKEKAPKKYPVPTEAQVAGSRAVLTALAEKARQEVDKNLHVVETPHYMIFSGFGKGDDQGVASTCEAMYKMLCRQFDVAEDETVWVGKCGIFLFTKPNHFVKFTMEIDALPETYKASGGYFKDGTTAAHIVMNAPTDKTGYKIALVHEGTHAFLSRFISGRQVPSWLNEGIADTSASMLVPSPRLAQRLKQATKEALKGEKNPHDVFASVKLEEFDYGIAQSWVQFLIARDRKAFIKLVTLCKQGHSEAEALKESYKLDRDGLLKAWSAAAAKGLRL